MKHWRIVLALLRINEITSFYASNRTFLIRNSYYKNLGTDLFGVVYCVWIYLSMYTICICIRIRRILGSRIYMNIQTDHFGGKIYYSTDAVARCWPLSANESGWFEHVTHCITDERTPLTRRRRPRHGPPLIFTFDSIWVSETFLQLWF